MDLGQIMASLLGGVLIGVSASLLLVLKGRIFGVSGIYAGILVPKAGDVAWRIAALCGLVAAGFVLIRFYPDAMAEDSKGTAIYQILAGLLVGFGTQMGGGCTSGHGVCGISRLSPRSMVATISFMSAGFLTVAIMRLGGLMP